MIYEYGEIITAKDVLAGNVKEEEIIGKEGWFSDSLVNLCEIPRGVYGVLAGIGDDPESIFLDKDDVGWAYFLPERKPSYVERQDEWLKANNIAGGDKVRIVRRAESHEDGWDNNWPARMDDDVGKVGFVVEDNGDKGIVVDTENGYWSYPYFVLEKVKDEPETEKSAPKRRTWLEDIAYRLYECMHTRYVAFCEQDDYLTVSGFTCKPCFSEENGIWYPGKSEKWSMYDLSIPDAAYSDCPEEWKVDGKVDFSKAIIDMEAGDGPASIKRAEDELEYVPFDLTKEEDRAKLRGEYLIQLYTGNFSQEEKLVVGFSENTVIIGGYDPHCFNGHELLGGFTFLDGSPCGKEMEEWSLRWVENEARMTLQALGKDKEVE